MNEEASSASSPAWATGGSVDAANDANDAILQVRNLAVRFGKLVAVDDVSFDAMRGHITSVIGPNGAGKSSLFNLISGAIRPTGGRVEFEGRDMTAASPDRMLAAGLARSFQITNLFFELPVRENLRLAARYLEGGRGLLRNVESSRATSARVDELVTRFSLETTLNVPAGVLSHGEQRRLEIAVALASRPRMLLLDEPTQGMSHSDTHETEDLIRSLAAEGLTILLVEHDVDLVMTLSDHVVVMHQGQKLAEGSPRQMRDDPQVQAAYFGDAAHA
jgi:branched-chain amino acid transport system ATP-binding protein